MTELLVDTAKIRTFKFFKQQQKWWLFKCLVISRSLHLFTNCYGMDKPGYLVSQQFSIIATIFGLVYTNCYADLER